MHRSTYRPTPVVTRIRYAAASRAWRYGLLAAVSLTAPSALVSVLVAVVKMGA